MNYSLKSWFSVCVLSSVSTAVAGVLQPGTEQLSFFAPPAWAADNGFSLNQNDAQLVWNSTLVAQIDATNSRLEVSGQLHYTWTIVNPGVQNIQFSQHQWSATAAMDPTFAGFAGINVSATGFFRSVGADATVNAPYIGFLLRNTPPGGMTGGYLQYSSIPTSSPDGATTPFSAATAFQSVLFNAGGGEALIDHIAIGDDIWLTPSSGSTFTVGSTIDLVIDYPIMLEATVVPEPGAISALSVMLVALWNRRRFKRLNPHSKKFGEVCFVGLLCSCAATPAFALPVYGWGSSEKSLWQGGLNNQDNVVNVWPPIQFPGPTGTIGVSASVVPIDIANGVGSSFLLTDSGFVVGCGHAPTPLDSNGNPTLVVWVNGAPGDPLQWLGRSLGAASSGTPQFVFGPNGGNLRAIKVASGGKSRSYHQLALTPEGTLVAWGGVTVNGSVTDAERMGCGQTGASWQAPKYVLQKQGSNALLPRIKDIAVSTWMSIGLSCEGEIFSWGFDDLTSSTAGNKYAFPSNGTAPASFYTGTNPSLAKQIDAGWGHYAYVAADGSLWMWGVNEVGQCAQATTILKVWPPRKVVFPTPPMGQPPVRIKQVSLGYGHTLALDSRGNVWAWGSNANGECRPGLFAEIVSPAKTGFGVCIAVAAGIHNSYVVLANGGAIGWGENDNSEMDPAYPLQPTGWPTQKEAYRFGTTNLIALQVGEPCMAMQGSGIPYLYGNPNPGARPHVDISLGNGSGVRLLSLSTGDCLGIDSSGRFGTGDPANHNFYPVSAMGAGQVDLATYKDSALLLKPGGELSFIGDDSQTNLADSQGGSGSERLVDTSDFDGLCTPIAIEMSGGVATVLMDNGTVYTSGSINSPLYGRPNPNKNTPASGGTPTSTVWNQVLVGPGQPLTEVIAISSNKDHTVALLSNGETKAWGSNGAGQCSSNTSVNPCIYATSGPMKSLRAIAAGNGFSIALRYDGTVWGYGANNQGQLGNGTNTSSIKPVPAGNVAGGEFSPLIAKEISAGDSLAYYLLPDGRIKASGSDSADVFSPSGPTHHKNRPTFVGSPNRFYKLSKVSQTNRIGAIKP